MLVFLISVPLLAIFGNDLPEVLKKLIDGRLSVQLTEQPKAADGQNVSTSAPAGIAQPTVPNNPFAGQSPYRAAPTTAIQATPTVPPLQPIASPIAVHKAAELANPAEKSPVSTPAAITTTSNVAPTINAVAASAVASAFDNASAIAPSRSPVEWPSPSSKQPESFQSPPDSRPIAAPESMRQNNLEEAHSGSSNQAIGSGDDKFRQAEGRLRQLGATQYVLETWGPQNDRYRFACRMAVGRNVGVTQHFEAIESDPWSAMEEVLRQVEQWQRKESL
ncbi:MAG: hypothetical protein IT427_04420 [Pirellulales bacterium]|nr:hypothetical protein [Pirellulales bacterium]